METKTGVTQPDLPKQEKEYVPEHRLWCKSLKVINFGLYPTVESIPKGTEMKLIMADSRTNTAVVIRPSGREGYCDLDEIELVYKHGHEARDTGT